MLKAVVFVFLGGGLGSVVRFLIGKAVLKMYSGNFPLGTLLSNTVSCLLIGAIVYLFTVKEGVPNRGMYFLMVTGFCGGLSTFSTFSLESFELIRQGNYYYALLNILLSLLVGLGAIYFLYNKSLN